MKLKPCPMCGKKKENIGINEEFSLYKVVCLSCGLQQVDIFHKTKEQAISTWNTRPAEQELLEALKESTKAICDMANMLQLDRSGTGIEYKLIKLIEKYEANNE